MEERRRRKGREERGKVALAFSRLWKNRPQPSQGK
jgi:hypothetical protein